MDGLEIRPMKEFAVARVEGVWSLPGYWSGAAETRKQLGELTGRGCLCLQIEAHLRAGKSLADILEFRAWKDGK